MLTGFSNHVNSPLFSLSCHCYHWVMLVAVFACRNDICLRIGHHLVGKSRCRQSNCYTLRQSHQTILSPDYPLTLAPRNALVVLIRSRRH